MLYFYLHFFQYLCHSSYFKFSFLKESRNSSELSTKKLRYTFSKTGSYERDSTRISAIFSSILLDSNPILIIDNYLHSETEENKVLISESLKIYELL